MPNESAGASSTPVTLNPEERPTVQQTYKELTELMLLERQLATAKTERERYSLLAAILDRELPIALNIPDPGARDKTRHDLWIRDMAELRKIDMAMESAPLPAASPPTFTPLAGEYPKVQYKMDVGPEFPPTLLMREDIDVISRSVMDQVREQAYLDSRQFLRRHHRSIRTILNRWGVWTQRTEMHTLTATSGESDIQRELDNAQADQPEPNGHSADETEDTEPADEESAEASLDAEGGDS